MEDKKVSTPMNKGLIISLIVIVISVITTLYVTDIQELQKYGYFSYIIIFIGIIWACWTYAADMKNNVTFGNVFAHGFKTTAVITSFVLIYTILSLTVIFPEMKDKMIEATRVQMEEQGQLNDSQIDQAVEMTDKFFLPFAIGGVIIMYLILGAITSLIGAAIVKKNPNPTPFPPSDNLS